MITEEQKESVQKNRNGNDRGSPKAARNKTVSTWWPASVDFLSPAAFKRIRAPLRGRRGRHRRARHNDTPPPLSCYVIAVRTTQRGRHVPGTTVTVGLGRPWNAI